MIAVDQTATPEAALPQEAASSHSPSPQAVELLAEHVIQDGEATPQTLELLVRSVLDLHLRCEELARRVVVLEASQEAVQRVLPSRARALSAETLSQLRQHVPYTELEVLEDWAVGSVRMSRGAVLRLDHYPRLEDSVHAGLLVGSHRETQEEQDARTAAEEASRARETALAQRQAREAQAEAAAAKARAEALSGAMTYTGVDVALGTPAG